MCSLDEAYIYWKCHVIFGILYLWYYSEYLSSVCNLYTLKFILIRITTIFCLFYMKHKMNFITFFKNCLSWKWSVYNIKHNFHPKYRRYSVSSFPSSVHGLGTNLFRSNLRINLVLLPITVVRGLGHELSSPTRALKSLVRILLKVWMSVCV
jgi:hypothetical protein